eukprot:3803254-Prymnesium_polylepis.3
MRHHLAVARAQALVTPCELRCGRRLLRRGAHLAVKGGNLFFAHIIVRCGRRRSGWAVSTVDAVVQRAAQVCSARHRCGHGAAAASRVVVSWSSISQRRLTKRRQSGCDRLPIRLGGADHLRFIAEDSEQ